jgi:hypothetical protein
LELLFLILNHPVDGRDYELESDEYTWEDNPVRFQSVTGGFGIESYHVTTSDEMAETVKIAPDNEGRP